VNTDSAPQRIDLSLDELRAIDEVPFTALVSAGVDAVMLSTAVYPALDDRPAALSRAWVRDELRGRLRFGGVTIADDLQTPAVRAYGTIPERAVLATRAGVDIPLFVGDYATGALAAAGTVDAVRRGELRRADIEPSVRRVLALRKRLER
jgi:beta-glucosidase-like glycosyl hydrolase